MKKQTSQVFAPTIQAMLSLTFLVTVFSLMLLSHVSISTFFEAQVAQSSLAYSNNLFMLQTSLAILLVSFPSWISLLFLSKRLPTLQTNLYSLTTFLLVLASYLRAIHFVYLILSITVTLQATMHTLASLGITTISLLLVATQTHERKK